MADISRRAQEVLLAIRAVDWRTSTSPRVDVEQRFNHIAKEFSDPKIFADALNELWDHELYAILDDEAPHYLEGLTSRGEALALELIADDRVVDLSDATPTIRADSATWTGNFDLPVSKKKQIAGILKEIRSIVEAPAPSNSQRVNAMALIDAIEGLVDTPDPLWPEIMMLLRSPVLANVTGVTALVLTLAQLLLASVRP